MAQPLRSLNEVSISQLISEDLHLVLAGDDHHQRRAVYGGRLDASDSDAAVTKSGRPGMSRDYAAVRAAILARAPQPTP